MVNQHLNFNILTVCSYQLLRKECYKSLIMNLCCLFLPSVYMLCYICFEIKSSPQKFKLLYFPDKQILSLLRNMFFPNNAPFSDVYFVYFIIKLLHLFYWYLVLLVLHDLTVFNHFTNNILVVFDKLHPLWIVQLVLRQIIFSIILFI